MTHQVGAPLPHESAVGHVTGAARYVDDLWPDVAHVAHGWPVQIPHAHARVLQIDSDAARQAPGVLAVLTGDDVPGENDIGVAKRDEPLFPTEVCFAGHAVAWVIAETEEQARVAAGLVRVECEALPAILSIEQAIAAESFLTAGDRLAKGDAAAALRTAPRRLEGEFAIGGQEHFYLETNAALAYRDEDGGMLVHSSTQHPTETQEIVARVLAVPKHAVVVQCLRMGGAFGGKEVQANAWAAIAALAASRLKRPVRVRLTRRQDMVMTGKRHPFLARFRVGYDDSGRLLALAVQLFSDGGWALDLSFPVLGRAMFHVDNCYHVPHVDVIGRVCRTHHVSHTAFRGFGGPQGMLAIEEIVDRVARSLDLPPHVVRERNFYRAGDVTHYGQVVRDPDRIARIWAELGASAAFEPRWAEVEAFNAAHAHVKRGLAITPVKFGISFTTSFYNQAGALVLVYKDGSIQVNHGGTEMGQGLHTKMRQVAADGLGVPLDTVRLMPTRTDKIPNTSATAASCGSDLNGAAVRNACDTIRERLADVAADDLAHRPREPLAQPEDAGLLRDVLAPHDRVRALRAQLPGQPRGERVVGRLREDVGRRALEHRHVRGGLGHRRDDGHRRGAAADHDDAPAGVVEVLRPVLRVGDVTAEVLDAGHRRRVALVVAVVAGGAEEPARGHLRAALDVDRPQCRLARPRCAQDPMTEADVPVDAVLAGGLLDVRPYRCAVDDRLVTRPRLERVRERVHVGVRADPGEAEQVPRPADRVARLEDRVRAAGMPRLEVARGADARHPGTHDQHVDVVGHGLQPRPGERA